MPGMNDERILVSSVDYGRLDMLLRDEVASGTTPRERILALRIRLQQAQVLAPSQMPGDVITMNSTVRLRDLDTDQVEFDSLMYPAFADGFQNRVSVLASLGTAILGYRAGDLITWRRPPAASASRLKTWHFSLKKPGITMCDGKAE